MMKKQERSLIIAVIQQTPDIGGAETYMYSLMKHLKVLGNTFYFATNLRKFELMVKDVAEESTNIPFILDVIGDWKGLIKSIILFPRAVVFYVSLLIKYKAAQVDVILMSGFSEKMLVTFLSQFIHMPVVWIEYGRLETIFKRNMFLPKILYQMLKRIPKAIVVPTKVTGNSLMTSAGIPRSLLQVIPCGTEEPRIIKNRDAAMPLDWKDAFIIGNVSRMTEEKGQSVLINAIPIIIRSHPEIRYIFVGDGPDLARYKLRVKELNIEQYVKFFGFVNDVECYYPHMDLFIFPTTWELEGFGLVMLEAMKHRVPIIASDLGPVPEILTDGRTGVLVPPSDSDALAHTVSALVSDKKKMNELAGRAFAAYKESYTMERVSALMQGVLRAATSS